MRHRELVLMVIALAAVAVIAALQWNAQGTKLDWESPASLVRPWAEAEYRNQTEIKPGPIKPPAPPPSTTYTLTRTSETVKLELPPRNTRSATQMPFHGAMASMEGPWKARISSGTVELAAIGVAINPQFGEKNDDSQQVTPLLFRLDGTTLTTATAAAEGLPYSLYEGRQWFNQTDYLNVRWAVRFPESPRCQIVSLGVMDALTHVRCSQGYSYSGEHGWQVIGTQISTFVSRPLELWMDLVELDATPIDVPVREDAVLTHPLFALRQVAWFQRPDEWGHSSGDDGKSSFYHFSMRTSGERSPVWSALLLHNPEWASSLYHAEAFDATGKLLDPYGGSGGSGHYLQHYRDRGSTPTLLRVYPPRKLYRIKFAIPRIPGLPELEGDNLLAQQIASIKVNDFEFESFLEKYGQVQLPWPSGFGGATPRSWTFENTTLAQMLDQYAREGGPQMRLTYDPITMKYEFKREKPWWESALNFLKRIIP